MELKFKKFEIKSVDNEKALYTFLELEDYVPDFQIKRTYFVQNFKQSEVGKHCHKIEEEVFIMTRGNCIALIDRGQGIEEIGFSHGEAMYVGKYVWHGFKDFSDKAMLLALSSTNYNPDRSDYVEDYDEYLELIANN